MGIIQTPLYCIIVSNLNVVFFSCLMPDREEDLLMDESVDLNIIDRKVQKIPCCRSYLLPKGRCYACPEELNRDPDLEKF